MRWLRAHTRAITRDYPLQPSACRRYSPVEEVMTSLFYGFSAASIAFLMAIYALLLSLWPEMPPLAHV